MNPKSIFHNSRRVTAKIWLALHKNVEVIGVTGSYGKTNTTLAIATVLAEKFKVLQTDINLDTRFNIPITVLKLGDHQKLVLEYGIDRIGEMDFHLFVARPNIAVVTGITPVHADSAHLGSLENIIKEKGELAAAVPKNGWVIINWDDQHARKIADLIDNYGLQKKKKSHPQTVHNELIKDKRFVLVGRGIYALSDWGYKKGTVKEVIEEILVKSGKPLTREEILLEVLKIRQVKKSTVIINLNTFFARVGKNAYTVKK